MSFFNICIQIKVDFSKANAQEYFVKKSELRYGARNSPGHKKILLDALDT